MKRQIALLGEGAIAAAVVAAAISIAVPVAPREPPARPAAAEPAAKPAEPDTPREIIRASYAATGVAALFGWKEPEPPRRPAAARAAPSSQGPVRLRLVGFAAAEDGTVNWVFKDSQKGNVIALALGQTNRGWTLDEVGDREFRLTFQGETYTVQRNR